MPNYQTDINKDSLFTTIETYIFTITVFFLIPPSYVWNRLSPLLLILIIFAISIKHIKFPDLSEVFFKLSFVIVFLYIGLRSGSNIFGYISLLGIGSLFFVDPAFLSKVFKAFLTLFAIVLIPSIFVFILVQVLHVNVPHTTIEPLNPLKDYKYLQYPFLVQSDSVIDNLLPRFFGYFDEPGVVGTISGVLLLCNNYDLKKKINIPIFVAGILSFSLAFLIITFVYGLLFGSTKFKIVLAITVAVAGIFLLDNEILRKYIFKRLEFEDGKLAGDNRMSSGFEYYYESFSKTDNYYFGMGNNASVKHNYGGASYKDFIVDFGLIPFIIFILLFYISAFFKVKFTKPLLIYLFILFSVLYQRPFITQYFYIFLLYAPLLYIASKKEEIV